MIDNQQKRVFAEAYYLSALDLNELPTINRDRACRNILRDFEEILSYNANEIREKRCNWFNVPGTTIDDFSNIIIQIDNEGDVLAGIRHVGGNPGRPFVYMWPGFTIRHEDELDRIKEIILPYFNKFSPQYLNFWLDPLSDLGKLLEKKSCTAQQCFAGVAGNIKNNPLPGNYNNIRLVTVKDDSYYSWYKKEYDDFHESRPELKDWVELNDPALMEKCRKEKLLFMAMVDNRQAGLIAGEIKNFLGTKAVYINEIMTAACFRGKKYAECIIRAFVNQLEPDIQMIWCYIDSRNIPSTKTALKSGQRIISREFFYPF